MILIHKNYSKDIISIYEELEDIIHNIFYIENNKYYNSFFLIYQSSFKRNGYYCMCLTSTNHEDEYIIVSNMFIPLKEINRLVKKVASMFFVIGGIVTNYGHE